MQQIRAIGFCSREDCVYVEIALVRSARADADAFVRKPDMQSVFVVFGIDRNRTQPQLFTAADDSDGNLPAIGHEYRLHISFLHSAETSDPRRRASPRRMRK
ncbi:hypothetical protein SDC9_55602 [bioreactor metagenome]|uniref:Uncharacterized protein n=1 Tax=bioreactor metagenome TaxID=1076179 RepID=A0A644WZD9_9ZZZZ